MKKYINGQYIEMAADEITALKTEAVKAQMEENKRPFTAEEVIALLIRQSVNALEVDDNTALRMMAFYPEWEEDVGYDVGHKVRHGGRLWRVVQAHTSQAGWEPENAASLWEQINETHSGTAEDPIPYEGNMVLEQGKHYVQDYVIYLCSRDTVHPVHHPLSELTAYVEAI